MATIADRTPADPLEAGRAAPARGAWQHALRCFRAALEDNVSPEALEGCGTAAWWLEEFPTTIASREEAYRAFRSTAGPRRGRAHATWLANDYADYQGELAVANGWIRPPSGCWKICPGAASTAYTKAHFALMVHRDPAEAKRLSAEAAEIGRTVGPAGFEMVGLALEGLALVTGGAVGRLMGRRARRTEPPRPVSAMAKSSPSAAREKYKRRAEHRFGGRSGKDNAKGDYDARHTAGCSAAGSGGGSGSSGGPGDRGTRSCNADGRRLVGRRAHAVV